MASGDTLLTTTRALNGVGLSLSLAALAAGDNLPESVSFIFAGIATSAAISLALTEVVKRKDTGETRSNDAIVGEQVAAFLGPPIGIIALSVLGSFIIGKVRERRNAPLTRGPPQVVTNPLTSAAPEDLPPSMDNYTRDRVQMAQMDYAMSTMQPRRVRGL
jgi:hypothetical protein